MKVAVVHHWFVTRGGGERVAECIASLFPQAEIFTLVASAAGLPAGLADRPLHTSVLQRLPLARTYHRHFLPFYPLAAESLDLRGFDLVLSSDSGPVKGVRLDPGARHICYCHSPMRYLWDGFDSYRAEMGGITRLLFTLTAGRVRRWDEQAAKRVDWFLANSRYVQQRIERCYGMQSVVLHPPIDLHLAESVRGVPPGSAYLCAGRLVSYKRTDVLIEAVRRTGRRLRIAGTGPAELALRRLAASTGAEVTFLGELSTADLWHEYASCRALLFAADEDFGMVPLEAQACGRPVIAYGAGGSLETVRGDGPQPTGLYFAAQTAESASEAIARWEAERESAFDPAWARDWAAGFAIAHFLTGFREFVLRHVPQAAADILPVTEALARVTGSNQAQAR